MAGLLFGRGDQKKLSKGAKAVLNEKNNKWYECLKDFSHLNGREEQQIAVADSADARTGRFLFLDRVKHNWVSQWRTRYKRGYIEFFENHKKFDLQNQTIGGKRVFLFNVTPEIYNLLCRQTFEEKIMRRMNEMPPNDRSAAERLIHELADSKGYNQFFRRSDAHALLPALSLSQLGDLAELFDVPNDGHKSESQAAAQSVEHAPLDSVTDPSPVKRPAPHTLLPAVNAFELGDLAELFDVSAHRTECVPPTAAKRPDAAPLVL
jgi:hypothetical protein